MEVIFVLSFQGDLDNLKFGQMNTLFQLFFFLSIILKQLLRIQARALDRN